MKKIVLLGAAVLGILMLVSAACIPEQVPENSKGIFYEVKGGDNEAYLFGSVHFGYEDMYPLDNTVEGAFQEADVLGLEVDTTAAFMELQVTEKMLQLGTYSEGKGMTDLVPQETFEEAAGVIKTVGIDSNTLNRFQPWLAAAIISEITIEEAGLLADYGVENYFIDQADEEKIDIKGLESIADQLAPYEKLSDESQVIYLKETLKEKDIAGEYLKEIIEHWKKGNVDYFAQRRQASIEETQTDSLKDFQRAMLDKRDDQMAAKIEEFVQNDSDSTYFIVVGAMHLAGENSIVEQLRDSGYEVEKAN